MSEFDKWADEKERWDGEHSEARPLARLAWDFQQARIEALEKDFAYHVELCTSQQARIGALTAEVEEQARLLGASGSREAELLARIEALENPNKERQVFAAKMLATFTQPDVDCYLLAGIIYTAMQEPKMAGALLQEPTK